nr:hypothetical protein [Tanacetum cinerariifolium]
AIWRTLLKKITLSQNTFFSVDSQSTPVVFAVKLPILNPNEFDLWKMRIEQYFLMTDYLVWKVIINGDSPVPIVIVKGAVQPTTILTTEQKLARRNELKARGTLLMALLDKHRLKLNSHKDAKTLMEAIEKRFGGNTETKKTHTLIWRNKANLKEHSLDELFNSLRIYEAKVKHSSSPGNPTQNIAFVSSSNTDSTTDSVSAATSVYAVCAQLPVSSHPNIDSLSNAVIFSFFASQSTSPQIDNEDLKQIDVDDLEEIDLRWQMAMLTMRARRFFQKTGRNLGDNRATTIGFDMSKVECYNYHKKGHFARECRSPKDNRMTVAAEPQRRHIPVETSTLNTLVSQCDRIGSYDWSYQAEEEPAKFALMAIPSSSFASDNEGTSCHLNLTWCFKLPILLLRLPIRPLLYSLVLLSLHKIYLMQPMAPIIEDWVSDSEDESEPNDPQSAPSFVQTFEHAKLSGHSVLPVEASILETTPNSTSSKTKGSRRKNRKTCFVCKGVDHLIKDYNFHAKPKTQPTARNSTHRGYDKQYASSTKKYPQKHIVPAAVITKSKPVSVTAARPVSAVVPKTMATKPRHARSLHTKTNSNIRRHKTYSRFSKTSNSFLKVTVAHAKIVSDAKGKKGN